MAELINIVSYITQCENGNYESVTSQSDPLSILQTVAKGLDLNI